MFDLNEIAEKYLLQIKRTHRAATVRNYTRTVRAFAAFAAGREPDAQTVEAFADSLAGRSPNTVKQYLTDLHAFFNYCVEKRLVQSNPIATKSIPKGVTPIYDLLSADEIETLIKAKPPLSRPILCRNYAIVTIALLCGLRNGEIRALHLNDIDDSTGTLTVREGKGGKKRIVPLPVTVAVAVRDYIRSGARPQSLPASAPLFGSYKEGNLQPHRNENENQRQKTEWHALSGQFVNEMLKRTTKKTIGREIHAHLFRHAAASYWDDMGVEMRDVQIALGHSSIRTTERVYVEVLNKSRAATAINAAFASRGI